MTIEQELVALKMRWLDSHGDMSDAELRARLVVFIWEVEAFISAERAAIDLAEVS